MYDQMGSHSWDTTDTGGQTPEMLAEDLVQPSITEAHPCHAGCETSAPLHGSPRHAAEAHSL